MKKTLITLITLGIIFFIYTKNTSQDLTANKPTTNAQVTKLFISADQSIKFSYRDNLSVSQKNNIITVHHEVPYTHYSACDMKGDGPKLTKLTDFHLTIQTFQGTIASTAMKINPNIDPQNFSGNTLKISEGFIDKYNTNIYNGYSVTEGVEGCGFVTYYLPISNSRTLVIQKTLIGELSDVTETSVREKILALPNIISPETAKDIFDSIMQSITIH